MKTDILKKSEGRNPRAERNPNAEARTDRPPISNLHRLARDSWLRTIAFSERQDYQTNPFLPNEPIANPRVENRGALGNASQFDVYNDFTKRSHSARRSQSGPGRAQVSERAKITKRSQPGSQAAGNSEPKWIFTKRTHCAKTDAEIQKGQKP